MSEEDPEDVVEGVGDYLEAVWAGMIKEVRVGPGPRLGDIEALLGHTS